MNIGLMNLGNTCFLNSCLQVLHCTPELFEIIETRKNILWGENTRTISEDCFILREWYLLREYSIQQPPGTVINPGRFVNAVHQIAQKKGREIFTGWAQNDVTEFLQFIMECMHNALARKVRLNISGKPKCTTDELAIDVYKMLKNTYSKEYSEIMRTFYGVHVSEIADASNKSVLSTTSEQFFTINLPCFSNNLYACFDAFSSHELLDGENAWYNEKTKQKVAVHKRMLFWNFPEILIIVLKRFSPDGRKKLEHLVDFPLENLKLSDYVVGYNKKTFVYDLYGVCNHMGNVGGGHYTAFTLNNGGWYHCNDSSVMPIDKQHIVSPAAYCLFYRKKK